MTPPPSPDPKLPVQAHFAKYPGAKYVDGWSSLWDKGGNLPWDRGIPNPALEDLLALGADTVPAPVAEDGQRRKALVPGCGRGVDVLLLASFGFDAYGLECSAAAVAACRAEEAKNHGWQQVRDENVGKGKVFFVRGDFFDDAWLKEIGVPRKGFDLIYDYTFFCALNPELRPSWALRHTELLASSPAAGSLICLESPRGKDPLAPGPPFASPSEAYAAHLSRPGETIRYGDDGLVVGGADPSPEAAAAGLERVAHWQPERTHAVGRDENGVVDDRISIWRRRE
ncbi:hypothetical protein PWT90_06491 [Aphanocladium album]|nr:hypothetical protein PWT90_06491 [Aphanocladium album]